MVSLNTPGTLKIPKSHLCGSFNNYIPLGIDVPDSVIDTYRLGFVLTDNLMSIIGYIMIAIGCKQRRELIMTKWTPEGENGLQTKYLSISQNHQHFF